MGQADAFEQGQGPGRVGSPAGERHSQQHVFQGRKAGEQIEGLKDVADACWPETGRGSTPAERAMSVPAIATSPESGRLIPAMMCSSVVLPSRFGPSAPPARRRQLESREFEDFEKRAVGFDERLLHVPDEQHG